MKTIKVGVLSVLALALFFSAGCSRPNEKSAVREAWDSRNRPEGFMVGTLNYESFSDSSRLSGYLPEKPWSDDYWPLNQAGLADRWLDSGRRISYDTASPQYQAHVLARTQDFLDHTSAAQGEVLWRLSPAEKYDLLTTSTTGANSFAFTKRELASYAKNLKEYDESGIPWGWMGHCHGWAPASVKVPRPEHPVLATGPSGRELLFLVGDIRGLLTKAYAENAMDRRERFVGTRCNRAGGAISRDALGRVRDGALGTWNGETTALDGETSISIVYNNWRLEGYSDLGEGSNSIVFRKENSEQLFVLRALRWTDQKEGIVQVEVSPYQAGGTTETFDFRYLKSCRDLNPGTFHLTLAALLSESGQRAQGGINGVVVDVSAQEQVWNQPVYGFKSKMGTPTPVALAIDSGGDPLAAFRAPGTEFLVHVITELAYGVENGPKVIYRPEDESVSSATYQYTLELDGEKRVIGGEWLPKTWENFDTLAPASDGELFSFLQSQFSQNSWRRPEGPDFIWGNSKEAQLTSQCSEPPCLKSATVHLLAECSRRAPDTTVDFEGETNVPVTKCAL